MSRAAEPYSQPDFVRRYRSAAGGCVDVHATHGKQELHQNMVIATFLADLGEHVCLLQVVKTAGTKNPDATRNGVEWEFKTPEGNTPNAIDRALRGASKQAPRILIQLRADFNLDFLEQALPGRMRRVEAIREVAVIWQDKLYHFSRAEVLNGTFKGKIS